jgi:signal transduction histidine kinase
MRLFLFLIMLVVALVPLWIGSTYLVDIMESVTLDRRMASHQNQVIVLRNHMSTSGYLQNSSDTVEAEIDLMAAFYNCRVMVIDENYRIVKDTYFLDQNKVSISSMVFDSMGGENQFVLDKDKGTYEAAVGIYDENNSEIVGVLYISFPIKEAADMFTEIERKKMIVELLALLVAFGVALWVSSLIVKPLKKIEQSIDLISSGNLKETISIRGYYETEQIAEAFNEMLQRLQESEDSRQEFVSNVSHELKTPITSMKVLADSLLLQEGIPEEMYKEFLGDIVKEIDRENDIITSLLTLVRMDKSAQNLKIEPKNINELVEAVLKRLRPIAAKKNIELVFESFRPVIADVDEVKMSMIINNLVENAIKYNILDGWVHISLNADHKYFYLNVSDSGMGIPEDVQDKVFDRFYRVDKARARQTGGTGLGLAITKSAVLLHRGSIKVYSKEDEGATFSVRIPLSFIGVERRDAE